MPKLFATFVFGLGLVGLVGCGFDDPSRPAILVFAATSLTDALQEIEEEFERTHDLDVAVSYGGSLMLARQIENGAPANLYISAGRFPVDLLIERRLIFGDPIDLLSNKLVVITRSYELTLTHVNDLTQGELERIAIADPNLAPAGRYAVESLKELGLFSVLEPKLVIGSDVRVTAAYVATGNVDAAIVYQTDALMFGDLPVFDIVPLQSYSEIVYPAAIVNSSGNIESAEAFLEYLQGEFSQAVFLRHGFDPL